MNTQDKMQEIHHKYGVTELANYEIQLFVDDLIKKDRAEQLILSGVKRSLDFAEWLDIYGIRDGEHEWKYKNDNYTKKYSTKQMFDAWQRLPTNKA